MNTKMKRSTKAGAETPATLVLRPDWRLPLLSAQQRPEPKLRRHLPIRMRALLSCCVAQQRPEPKLRRHRGVDDGEMDKGETLNKGRSRNSGDTPTGGWG